MEKIRKKFQKIPKKTWKTGALKILFFLSRHQKKEKCTKGAPKPKLISSI